MKNEMKMKAFYEDDNIYILKVLLKKTRKWQYVTSEKYMTMNDNIYIEVVMKEKWNDNMMAENMKIYYLSK